jgi:hypothetical protein
LTFADDVSSTRGRPAPEWRDKVAVIGIVAIMATLVILVTGSASPVVELSPLLLGILTVLYAPRSSPSRANRRRRR